MEEGNHNLQPGFTFGGWLPKIFNKSNYTFDEPNFSLASKEEVDNYFMYQAYLAGMENASISNPNPSVGCVIVKNNKILSSGCTRKWGDIHAEKDAFLKLKDQNLEGAQVYLTLEPCVHIGNQPPCIDLFRNKGIERVQISRSDLNPLVSHKGIQKLEGMGINVEVGFLQKEVTAWNYPFFIQQKYQRPMISLSWSQSVDGCLFSSEYGNQIKKDPLSKKYSLWLKQKYDVVLHDEHTLLSIMPSMDFEEINEKSVRTPFMIIIDPKARILLCSKKQQTLLNKKYFRKNVKTLFLIDQNMIREVLSSSSEWYVDLRTNADIKILPLKSEFNFYSAKDILVSICDKEFRDFFGRPLQSIFVEGGTQLLNLFIQDEMFDVAHMFTCPFVLGETKNKLFAQKQDVSRNSSDRNVCSTKHWQIIAQEKLGNDALLEMTPESRFSDILY